jgi:hypothetical protein
VTELVELGKSLRNLCQHAQAAVPRPYRITHGKGQPPNLHQPDLVGEIAEGEVGHVGCAQLDCLQGLLGVHERVGPVDLDLDLALGPFRDGLLEMHHIVGARRSGARGMCRYLEDDLRLCIFRNHQPGGAQHACHQEDRERFGYCLHVSPF